jgi:hypothetical protein
MRALTTLVPLIPATLAAQGDAAPEQMSHVAPSTISPS